MSPEDLVRTIHADSERTIAYYDSFFDGEPGDDPAWNWIRAIYRDLGPNENTYFWQIVRTIQSDSICGVLSLLDNQTYPAVQTEDLVTLHGIQQVSGDLTDIYIGMEQDSWDGK